MYDTTMIARLAKDRLVIMGLDNDIQVPAQLVWDLLMDLLAHPFILESTCGDCEEIQNSIDNLCESITKFTEGVR